MQPPQHKYTGAPSLRPSSSSIPGPAPAVVRGEGRAPARPKVDPAKLTLQVDHEGHVYLSPELALFLNLEHKQPIDLDPPTSRNGLGPWHLDCRNTAKASLTDTIHSDVQFHTKHRFNPKSFCQYVGRGKFAQCYLRLKLALVVGPLQDFDYYTFKVVGYANPTAQ